MTPESLAHLYVNYLLPAGKVLGFLLIVLFALQLINLMSGSKKFENIDKMFNMIMKIIAALVVSLGRLMMWLGRTLLKIINVLFDTIRDFFTSKI